MELRGLCDSMNANTSQEFFEKKYQRKADPWDFAGSKYELGRYNAILEALKGRRYARAFEPGCSVGVLTKRLATICDRVEAVDISSSAVAQAKERCRGLENVHLTCGSLADSIPAGEFDLIVLSEIGYYFEEKALTGLVDDLSGRLSIGGTLLAAHWLGESKDHVLSGDRVHELLAALSGFEKMKGERFSGFRLDCWRKR